MLRSAKDLFGAKILATDGQIGKVHDFLFDDGEWVVRYMVADTGNWLSHRLVLIAPEALGTPDWEGKAFPVDLTRREIEDSPPIEKAAPLLGEQERALRDHFKWPLYTGGGTITGGQLGLYPEAIGTATGTGMTPGDREVAEQRARLEQPSAEGHDSHLRSVDDVTGYHIEAVDGEIGHVEDFLLRDDDWSLRYVAVDTRNWLPGKQVLVSPEWISAIDWVHRTVGVGLERGRIEAAPEYTPGEPVTPEYEEELHAHYGLARRRVGAPS